jgi:predicted membrane-bound mannosyltransferase
MSFFAGVMLATAVLAVGLLVRQRQRGRAVYLPVEEKGDF